ncbi:MAG: cell wall hydrolase [Bacillota bacterium]
MSTSCTRAALVALLLAVALWFAAGAAAGNEENGNYMEGRKDNSYSVQEGDNLYNIARKNDVSLKSLIRANKLTGTVIYPGQVLLIPGKEPDFEIAVSRGYTRDDVMMLARAIYAEARGESFQGQVAVGAVILNRVESGEFPKTIKEVIMQCRGGTYQFTPVQDGSIKLEPDYTSICAAIQAMAGHDPTGGALYFYNPKTASDKWIKSLPVSARIGNHVFAYDV